MAHLHRLSQFGSLTSRKLSTAASAVKNVTVVGSGLMGCGIAQVAAQASFSVNLVDQSEAILKKSLSNITESLKRVAKKKCKDDEKAQSTMVSRTLEHITTTMELEKAISKSDLVIEAVVENLSIKQKLFAQIERIASESALLATNTSSLRLCDIAKDLKRKSNFGGLHFFNPVPVMKLCEVVRTDDTSESTFRQLQEFAKAVGKTTVVCKAVRMVERGDASLEDIDIAMKLGAGYPMGPFELLDYVGLDTTKFIMDGWHKIYPHEKQFEASDLLNKLVKEGKLGKKTGHGFYSYS